MDLIIGGGISGISYANFTKNDFLVVEKEYQIGGYCRTIKKSGYTWDYSGHFFHFQNPEIETFVCKNIDRSALLKREKHTQIFYKDKYIDFPFQKNIHQLDKEEFIDCLYDLFTTEEQNGICTFKEMIYSHYGKAIAEKFLIPYNEKLYACSLDTLDVNAMGRFFPKASREEIVRNFRNSNNSSYNSFFTYPRNGAIEYVNSLMKNISDANISVEEELISVDVENKVAYTNKRSIKYDNLISTLPFPYFLDKCRIAYPKDVFSCNKVLVFNLGFDTKGHDRVNNWVYFPEKTFSFYRVGYYDNILEENKMSLYVELGFPENEKLKNESYYLENVIKDLKIAGIITTQKLVDYEAILMNPAYVHINSKSVDALLEYKRMLAVHDIYSIGRYGSWTYCSIEDNIVEAKILASKL